MWILALVGVWWWMDNAKGMTRAQWEAIVSRLASDAGVPPRLALAIVDTENPAWNPRAVNMGPGDAARGGAYGLLQLTAKTARDTDDAHGKRWLQRNPTRPASDLAADPTLTLQLSMAHLSDLSRAAARTYTVGTQAHARDVASRWNSGRTMTAADLPASTRDAYLPRFDRRYAEREAVA